MKLVIWWPRRVIRLQNNPVLEKALSFGFSILPLYIFEPRYFQTHSKRNQFLVEAVNGLRNEIIESGAMMSTAYGYAIDVFSALGKEIEIVQIVTEASGTPMGKQVESKLERIMPLIRVQSITVHDPDSVRKPDGTPYRKYSAYRTCWLGLPFLKETKTTIDGRLLSSESIRIPFPEYPPNYNNRQSYTNHKAQLVLTGFLNKDIHQYAELRNRIDLDATSHCSHLFRFGILSPLDTVKQVQRVIEENDTREEDSSGARIWLDELIWREFFNHLMDSYNTDEERLRNKDGSLVQWRESQHDLRIWQEGNTGYPLVDAAMRQLFQTGWMPNRARMVVASFLVKDLFLWWRLGEQWFMKYLLDGDPAANHGNWQWAAGIGTDAAPFFRVFNPVLQSKKFDTNGNYIRTWLPELKKVPTAMLHEPWKMNLQDQAAYDCHIGRDYPAPLVMHDVARLRALELFRMRKKG